MLAAPGCSDYLTYRIFGAPNHGRPDGAEVKTPDPLVDHVLHVTVGPPPAALEAWVVDPKRFIITSTEQFQSDRMNFEISYRLLKDQPPAPEPRGTVILLHGMESNKELAFSLWGAILADAGFRVVAVDLRGHGRSTGRWLTFGVVEAHDIHQLIDQLQTDELLLGPLILFGGSYGGTVALRTAGLDDRVDGVIAIAPFRSLAAIQDSAGLLIKNSSLLSRLLITDRTLQAAIDKGCARGGITPQQTDAAPLVAQTRASILLIHGREDKLVPLNNSLQLGQAARGRCQWFILSREQGRFGHFQSLLPWQPVRQAVLHWLDEQTPEPTGDVAHE